MQDCSDVNNLGCAEAGGISRPLLVGWGCDGFGQATVPEGTSFIAIAAGGTHSVAIIPRTRYPYPSGHRPPGFSRIYQEEESGH